MNLEPGRSLLFYRLVEKIGEGGMGVVWKAVDTKLDRPVAIKILPQAVAADDNRLARFEREARLLAALNHPNIATIHGLHEDGPVRFLAMELIEGEDLAQRLARGALEVDEVVRIATRVAEALEAAHDNGIVHRDLKPANVALTADGSVKVLDFGLAKALEPDAPSSDATDLSPTLTSAQTAAGMVLGTAGYMSPEQARGHAVDARADVWALGCLIYEMLTGGRAYPGKTVSDTLAAVLRADPEWDALPTATPPGLVRVVKRCLVKDARDRVRHAGDVRLDLVDLARGDEQPPSAEQRRSAALPTGLAAIAVLAVALAAWGWLRPRVEPDPARPAHFEVPAVSTPDGLLDPWSLTISPDGRRLAWTVNEGASRSIWVRDVDTLEARRLPDTEGGTRPAFSPDGRSIAFFAQGKLRRLDLDARAAIDLCDAVEGAGISWTTDGAVVFNAEWIRGLSRVPEDGGTAEDITTLDPDDGEIGHWFPDVLPDDRHVLITRWRTGLEDISVAVVDLETGEARDLVPRASFGRFVPSGHLLFARSGAIYVVPFDVDRLAVTGRPVELIDGVEQQWSSGDSPWTVSDTGVLAYLSGGLWSTKRPIVRVRRDGTVEPVDIEPRAYFSVAISPDGAKLAMTEFENGKTNVVVRDLERGIDTRLPPGAVNTWPMWGPDSRSIVFTTARDGPWDIYRVPVDGSADAEPLVQGAPDQIPLAWSSDGRFLVWQEAYSSTRIMDLAGDRERSILPVPTGIIHGQEMSLSPDSRWLAFGGFVSGQAEVFVQRFPEGVRAVQLSIGGGDSPLWTRDGRSLFYRRGDAVFEVAVRVAADDVTADRPRELFRGDFVTRDAILQWSYDPSTDTLIFIGNGEHEIDHTSFKVLLDWPAVMSDR